MAKKKKGSLFKKLWGEIKDVAKGVGKGIHKIGKNIVEVEQMVVLAPFKKAMKKQLDKKGIKHSNKLKDIAPKFLKHVVKGSHFENYQGDLKHYEDYESLERLENIEDYNYYWANGEIANLDPATATQASEAAANIVQVILDFFKTILTKKKDNQPSTDAEKEMVEDAEKGAEKADELIHQEATGKMNIMYIAVAVIIIAFLMFRKK